ncbi:hypothetical protein [Thalassotalea sp. PS06]|uniref:hypothetical protein n=1 Tax=Thalassotalea sp. PS06 TaxID=2594005 RepID=UPI001162AD92|nr:hypothetical protein [Thalassotalea sp. PS06]QDP02292.1 hypothetical protein FNC98_13640 [Thalassotalea sp. PS06]
MGITSFAQAGIIWDESVDGDLSDDFMNPTQLVLQAGDNLLLSQVGNITTDYSDYFSLSLSADLTLSQIVVIAYAPGNNNSSTAFDACNAGVDCSAFPLQIYDVTLATVGMDLFPVLGLPALFRLGESAGPASLEINFIVDRLQEPRDVPLPGTILLILSGMVGFMAKRLKSKS